MQINDKTNPQAYQAASSRYESMPYRICGKSGIKLPALSLGLWHNFGFVDHQENARNLLKTAFDHGITHFDLANNYGPPYGSAETNFGTILKKDFQAYRYELFIATKAGYDMWPGPYGNGGSRKYLITSLEQSLQRMNLDYVDLFYHHRPDPETPLEETMGALHDIVRQGKALYVGISNYSPEESARAASLLREMGTPCFIHQMKYSMFHRLPEEGLLEVLDTQKIGGIAFSPLAQGMLSNKYADAIPEDSRASRDFTYLNRELVEEKQSKIKSLYKIAQQRGQSLSQMAIAWLLKDERVTSVLIGARNTEQLEENIASTRNLDFDEDTLQQIEQIIAD